MNDNNYDKFILLLKEQNLNKSDFAKISDTPVGTVNGWGKIHKTTKKVINVPRWAFKLLEYYKYKDRYLEAKKLFNN